MCDLVCGVASSLFPQVEVNGAIDEVDINSVVVRVISVCR